MEVNKQPPPPLEKMVDSDRPTWYHTTEDWNLQWVFIVSHQRSAWVKRWQSTYVCLSVNAITSQHRAVYVQSFLPFMGLQDADNTPFLIYPISLA